DDFLPGLRSDIKTNTYRFGVRHAFAPGSIILGSFLYQEADFHDRTDQLAPPVNFVDIKTPQNAFSGEAQYLFRSQYVNITSGIGHFNIDAKEQRTIDIQSITIPLPPPLPPMILPAQRIFQEENADIHHTNLYLYSYIKLVPNVTFTA